MSRALFATLIAALVVLVAVPTSADPAAGKRPPKLENLLRTSLARVDNTEVIVTRVTLGPDGALPRHWHPGEELAYVLEGSVTLSLDGKEAITGAAGDVVHVPFQQVHSVKAGKDGAVVVVFRVHESGKPERVLVQGAAP